MTGSERVRQATVRGCRRTATQPSPIKAQQGGCGKTSASVATSDVSAVLSMATCPGSHVAVQTLGHQQPFMRLTGTDMVRRLKVELAIGLRRPLGRRPREAADPWRSFPALRLVKDAQAMRPYAPWLSPPNPRYWLQAPTP